MIRITPTYYAMRDGKIIMHNLSTDDRTTWPSMKSWLKEMQKKTKAAARLQ